MAGFSEELYYISCMIIGNVGEHVPTLLLQNHLDTIRDYIGDAQTATTIHRMGPTPPSRQVVTSELIYYWMIKFGVHITAERWHFNRLMTLIDVCNVKEGSGKDAKMSTQEAAVYRHQLNKARRGQ